MKYLFQAVCILGLLCPFHASAFYRDSASVAEEQRYTETHVRKNAFTSRTWNDAKDGIHYQEPQRKAQPEKTPFHFPKWGIYLKYAAYLFAAVLLATGIYFLIRYFSKANSDSTVSNTSAPGDPEKELLQADLNSLLNEALQKQQWRQAIRLHFLITLKYLCVKRLLIWKRSFTNKEYLFQLVNTSYFQDFKQIIRSYEQTWYGQNNVTESDMQAFKMQCEQFVTPIR